MYPGTAAVDKARASGNNYESLQQQSSVSSGYLPNE
jgi:hypothetical protein